MEPVVRADRKKILDEQGLQSMSGLVDGSEEQTARAPAIAGGRSVGTVTIRRGRATPIAAGRVWEAFVRGEALTDPDSGISPGYGTLSVGRVEITDVPPNLSRARVLVDNGIDRNGELRHRPGGIPPEVRAGGTGGGSAPRMPAPPPPPAVGPDAGAPLPARPVGPDAARATPPAAPGEGGAPATRVAAGSDAVAICAGNRAAPRRDARRAGHDRRPPRHLRHRRCRRVDLGSRARPHGGEVTVRRARATWRVAVAVALGAAGALLAGCLQTGYRNRTDEWMAYFSAGRFAAAVAAAAPAADAAAAASDSDDAVADLMEAGRIAQAAGDVERSTRWFGAAIAAVRPYLDEEPEATVREYVAAALVNQTQTRYRGTVAERVMLSTLQAVNHLAAGRPDEALVELRLAHEWQREAVARNAARIEKAGEAARERARSGGVPLEQVQASAEYRKAMESYAHLGDMRGYADHVNPFSTLLYGEALLAAGGRADAQSAAEMFHRVGAVLGGEAPEAVALAIRDAEVAAAGAVTAPSTLVVVMAGLAPRREELKVVLPLPIPGSPPRIVPFTAAFPILRRQGGGNVEISAAVEGARHPLRPVCSVARIVAAEFESQRPAIIALEIVSAATKALAADVAHRQGGVGGLAAGLLYQLGTTAADLRSWRSLPAAIHVARVATPADGRVTLGGKDLAGAVEAQVEPGSRSLVLVTLPAAGTPPGVIVARLGAAGAAPTAAEGASP